jgi:hypothetical protein
VLAPGVLRINYSCAKEKRQKLRKLQALSKRWKWPKEAVRRTWSGG